MPTSPADAGGVGDEDEEVMMAEMAGNDEEEEVLGTPQPPSCMHGVPLGSVGSWAVPVDHPHLHHHQGKQQAATREGTRQAAWLVLCCTQAGMEHA